MTNDKFINVGAIIAAFERVADGESYTGPTFEWTCPALAATRPEPHIALDSVYLDNNDIDADTGYLLSLALAVGVENGWRLAQADRA